MNDGKLIDVVSQTIQTLRDRDGSHRARPLLRIDNLNEAAQAPYQFDAASGRLHRRGCRAIPAGSRLALYGVWRIGPKESKLACSRCRPEPMKETPDDRNDATDMLFGLVSLIDQFGSVLRERGREYRQSEDGRQLGDRVDGLFQRLDRREQDFLSSLLTSMDGLVKAVRDIDDRLNEDRPNGHDQEDDQAHGQTGEQTGEQTGQGHQAGQADSGRGRGAKAAAEPHR